MKNVEHNKTHKNKNVCKVEFFLNVKRCVHSVVHWSPFIL